MSDDTATRKSADRLRRYASTKGRTATIPTPVTDSAFASSRDDLDALLTRSFDSEPFRPQTSDGSKTKKRVHVADMLIDQDWDTPSRDSSSIRRPTHSPTGIGIALGSPTHGRWIPDSRNRPIQDSKMPLYGDYSSSTHITTSSDRNHTSQAQPKRGLFNSIFGRKASNAAQRPFEKGQTPASPATPAMTIHRHDCINFNEQSITTPPATTTPKWNEMTRKPSVGQLMRKPSLGFRSRTNKSPSIPTNVPTLNIPIEPPMPPPKDVMLTPSLSTSGTLRRPAPLLNVEIPDTTMERYSIMFSDILKPRQPLLLRRQTQLRGLQIIDDSVPDFSTPTPEITPMRRATAPSPRSPRLSLSPMPPSSETKGSQRTGLSRSNTVPSPNRQVFTEKPQTKQKESQVEDLCSPSHGSETPLSMHSDWPSDGSIDISELGEESSDEASSGDIIIQLGDLSMLPESPPQPISSAFSQPKPLYQPNLTVGRPSNSPKLDELKHSPRTSSRAQFAATQVPTSSSPALQRKASLPVGVRSIGGVATRQNTAPAPATSKPQQAATKAGPYFNPLQSSPASPSEITIARQMSLSRVHTTAITPVPKTARQPQPITLVDASSFPEPKGWRSPLPLHMRNKSEHIVLESA